MKEIKDEHGVVHELAKDMVLQAISKLAQDATRLFADCPETVSLRTANPKLSEAFRENTWQVICHDERLPVGQHGRMVPGFMLNRNIAKESTMNKDACQTSSTSLPASAASRK